MNNRHFHDLLFTITCLLTCIEFIILLMSMNSYEPDYEDVYDEIIYNFIVSILSVSATSLSTRACFFMNYEPVFVMIFYVTSFLSWFIKYIYVEFYLLLNYDAIRTLLDKHHELTHLLIVYVILDIALLAILSCKIVEIITFKR
jgi:hypothetical protein